MLPIVSLVALLCLVAACSGSPGGSPGDTIQGASPSGAPGTSLQSAGTQPSQEPVGSAGVVDLPSSVIDPVVADAAKRAGVSLDQVAVLTAEAVTFPDGSLGCPVPGMVYPQVQVDGYRIVVAAAGTTYDYRGTGAGSFRLCTPQE